MADNLKLDKTIQVNGTLYDVTAVEADTAKVAEKVTGTLTIKAGDTELGKFDGSTDKTIEVPVGGGGVGEADSAGRAEEIKVYLDNRTEYATITISKDDPKTTDRELGDIWFKYN